MIDNSKLPNSQPAEISVLCTIMYKNETISRVEDILNVNDFFNLRHRDIYDCMLKLHKEKMSLGLISLQNELINRKQLEEIGGYEYLLKIQDDVPEPFLIEKHAQIIKDKSLLREMITFSLNQITFIQNIGTRTIDHLFDEAEKAIIELGKKRIKSAGYQLNIHLKNTIQQFSMIKANESGLTGITSGFNCIDKITNGFQKSDLIILAARPAMGKTSLAINMAVNAAKKGASVGILSLEMSANQLCIRMLSTETEINQHLIKNYDANKIDSSKLIDAFADLASLNIVIDDTGSLNIMNIRTMSRSFKLEHNINLLIIDYLQLINSLKRNDGRVNEISEITRSLKALAKELDIPIICLSQLSRKCEDREDKRPVLSDLRDSGSIEQDADMVMFIYRDCIYNKEADLYEAEILISKNRHGPIGRLSVSFEPTLTKFYER